MQPFDPERFRIVVQLSSAPATLDIAERLNKLARRSADHRKELLAAAAVAAATALAQAVDAALLNLAGNEWGEAEVDSTDPREGSLGELFNLTFRQKVLRLPRILSHNQLRFKDGHSVTQALNQLIDRRNRLVHIVDEPHLVTGDHSSVRFTDDQRMEIQVPIPPHPWHAVSEPDATQYIEAVREYLEHIASAPLGSATLEQLPFLERVH